MSLPVSLTIEGQARKITVFHCRTLHQTDTAPKARLLVKDAAVRPTWLEARVDTHGWLSQMGTVEPGQINSAANACFRIVGVRVDILCGRLTATTTNGINREDMGDDEGEPDDDHSQVQILEMLGK
jgi:hypothetical protein